MTKRYTWLGKDKRAIHDLKTVITMALEDDATLLNDAAESVVVSTVSDWDALDIWPAFYHDGNGADSWNATTYSGWISGIDAALAGDIASGDVVKTDLGASSDPTRHLYSYAAGEGKALLLLTGGTHGNELIGHYAPMRWFQSFVEHTNPVMRRLWRQFRVIWVPSVNPASYRTARRNANSIDLNRNYAFFWSRYVAPSTDFAKGAAAWDQPESTIIKELVEDNDIRISIDCHDLGGSHADELIYAGPSPFVLGQRQLMMSAVDAWHSVYNPDGTYTSSDLMPNSAEPSLTNWFNYYVRWVKGKRNAASLNPEAPGNLEGSTSSLTTRGAMRLYNGFLTLYLLRWLSEGQAGAPVYPFAIGAYRHTEAATTSISAGGTLLDTSTATALTFEAVGPTNTVQNQNYVDVVVPYAPASIFLHASGYVESDGAGGRVDFYLTENGVQIAHSLTSILVPANSGERAEFLCQARVAVASIDAATVRQFKVMAQRFNTTTAKLKRYRITIEVFPSTADQPVPIANPTPS